MLFVIKQYAVDFAIKWYFLVIFNHSNSQYNGDNYDTLITSIHFFLNRIINIITDHCHNKNQQVQ